jgi:two-component system sensor histidine kinase/response regulator
MNASQQPLILVVDDQREVLDEVAAVIRAAGYACHGCTTGEAAAEFTRSHVPDLLISDTNLDGQSGLALCERLKDDPALRRVPVMFLSRTQIPDIIRRSHTVGGTYYLRKPLDPMVLVELIDKALCAPHQVHSRADCQPQAAGQV